jgi:hypothetical protein
LRKLTIWNFAESSFSTGGATLAVKRYAGGRNGR